MVSVFGRGTTSVSLTKNSSAICSQNFSNANSGKVHKFLNGTGSFETDTIPKESTDKVSDSIYTQFAHDTQCARPEFTKNPQPGIVPDSGSVTSNEFAATPLGKPPALQVTGLTTMLLCVLAVSITIVGLLVILALQGMWPFNYM